LTLADTSILKLLCTAEMPYWAKCYVTMLMMAAH